MKNTEAVMTDGCLRSDGKGRGGPIHLQRLQLQFTAKDYTFGWISYIAGLSSRLATLTCNKQSFMVLSFIFSSSIILRSSIGQ